MSSIKKLADIRKSLDMAVGMAITSDAEVGESLIEKIMKDAVNKESEIKDVKWEGQYGFLEGGFDGKSFWDGGGFGITYVPVCPHCGEFAYEESECVFCHGKYNLDWSKQPPSEPESEECEDKSVLMSIKPQWVAKILNGEKTIEVRKKFPKDFVGWVYIYCTKGGVGVIKDRNGKAVECNKNLFPFGEGDPQRGELLNGKVVARFWCDKVETYSKNDTIRTSTIENTCLTSQELWEYAGDKDLCFIHISDLEAFEEPEELKGKAPQSWRYLTPKEEIEW